MGAWAKVDYNVKDGPADDRDQLGLGFGVLKVEATNDACFGVGKVHFCPWVLEGGMKSFREEGTEAAARVWKLRRGKQGDSGEWGVRWVLMVSSTRLVPHTGKHKWGQTFFNAVFQSLTN